jgi:hypothetical protein
MKRTILAFGITVAILVIAATFGLGGVPTPEGYEVLGGGNRP